MVVDAAVMRESYDIDADELGLLREVRAGADGTSDPRLVLAAELASAIPPMNVAFDNVHLEAVEIGPIDTVVGLPVDGVVMITTNQDPEQLTAVYADAGFEPQGDSRWFLPEGTDPRAGAGGFPAVAVDDGQLVLGRSVEALDLPGSGDGASAALQALLDDVDDAWGLSAVAQPDEDPGTCGAGQALVRVGGEAELRVLGGGTASVPDDAKTLLSDTTLGAAEIDGVVTRYPVEADTPLGEVAMLGWLAEMPQLAEC